MAEFCRKCAKKYGLEPEEAPLFCEGCNKNIERFSFFKWITSLFKS